MKDGLRSEQMRSIDMLAAGSITADLISGAGLYVGPGEVGSTEIADNAITATQIEASSITSVKQAFASTGSPPTGGYILQAGAGTLGGGSVWVAYPTPFTAAPTVVTTITDIAVNKDVNVHIAAGSVDTGSFIAVGSDAASTFNWMALGSGAF